MIKPIALRTCCLPTTAARCLGIGVLALALALPTAAPLAEDGETAALPAPSTPALSPDDPRTPYEATVTGVEPGPLLAKLTAASRLLLLKESPPATLAGLRRRADDDAGRLRQVLAAEARFGAVVAAAVQPGEDGAAARVDLTVEPGPPYALADFVVVYTRPDSADLPQGFAAAGLTPGMEARADPILAGIDTIAERLHEQGYPFARVEGHKAVLHHDSRTVEVVATIDPGPAATFGPLRFSGLENVEEGYLRGFLPWREGETWDARKVAALKRDYLDTALFETVDLQPAAAPGADGRLALDVRVKEAAARTIGGGVSYSSTLGAGVQGTWEHRNLLGEDENLAAELALSQVAAKAALSFRKPHWLDRKQDLTLGAQTIHEELDAYTRDAIGLSAGIERPWRETWKVGFGTTFEAQTFDDHVRSTHAELLGFPLFARNDTTDSPLDPRRGLRYGATFTPYTGLVDEEPVTFFATRLDGSAYLPLGGGEKDNDYVLALRGALGSLLGAGQGAVPPDKRTYVGGGGSVRGYGHQMAGEVRRKSGNPVGGKSLIDLGIELRAKVTDSIEIVPFLEAGRAYEDTMPDLGKPLFFGAGLGFRYHTPIGPARLDVAVPLDKRDVDDPFQIYISLGQAF